MRLKVATIIRAHQMILPVLLLVLICVLSASAQTSNPPTAIIDLVPVLPDCTVINSLYELYDCSGSSVALKSKTSEATISLPTGTSTPNSSVGTSHVYHNPSPQMSYFILPDAASVYLGGLPTIPRSNTTIKLKVMAQLNPSPTTYTSILSMWGYGYVDDEVSIPSRFTIGQRGSSWTYGRLVVDSMTPGGYWLTPWEPSDLYPSVQNVYEEVYYTFTTDGRLRLDVFTPYYDSNKQIKYVWQESVQDGGWPLHTLSSDIDVTTNPTDFLESTSLVLGAESPYGDSSYSLNSSSTVPAVSKVGISEITIYDAAMSTTDMIDSVGADFPSSNLDNSMSPCNTGKWMNGPVKTPCGTNISAHQPVPAPPVSVKPVDYYTPSTPIALTRTAIGGTWATFTWTAPPTVGVPLYYELYAVPKDQPGINVMTAIFDGSQTNGVISNLKSKTEYVFYLETSNSYWDVNSDQLSNSITAKTTINAAGPIHYNWCADQSGNCVVSDNHNVITYGTPSHYFTKTVVPGQTYNCDNSLFSAGDPDPGNWKSCYTGASNFDHPVSYAFCSNQGGNCDISGTSIYLAMAFGASPNFVYKGIPNYSVYADMICCLDFFHGVDPSPGKAKKCYYKANDSPIDYPTCAAEGGACRISNAEGGYVFYGRKDSYGFYYTFKKFPANSEVVCSIEGFGLDPSPGYTKQCLIRQ